VAGWSLVGTVIRSFPQVLIGKQADTSARSKRAPLGMFKIDVFRSALLCIGLVAATGVQAQPFRMLAGGELVSVLKGDTYYMKDARLHFPDVEVTYAGKLGSYKVRETPTYAARVAPVAHWDVEEDNGALVLTIRASRPQTAAMELMMQVERGVRWFGGGEQYSHVELTGHRVPFIVEENGIGRGDHPATGVADLMGAGGHAFSSYLPIPIIMGTDNTAYLIENDCYSEVDLSVAGRVGFKVHDGTLRLRVWKADSPKELLRMVTAHLGRMAPLPDWTYGTILGIQGGADVVRQRVQEAKAHGNPVSAIWIQDWVGKKKTSIGSRLHWEWRPDSLTYPNFRQFCADMKAQDVRVLGYINPFLLEGTAMTNEAVTRKLVVHRRDGTPYLIPFGGFKGYMLDLTNPDARLWIKDIIKRNMMDNGLSGWMADFAEWLPFDAQLHSGIAPKDHHNRYAADWALVNREAIREAGREGDILFFSRSGWTGSAGISTLFWAGDQMVSFQQHDGLPSAINAMLSSGLSGLAINHSDIGGYTALNYPIFKKYLRDRELLYRWTELEAFTPLFRTHEGLLPMDMVQYYTDKETQEFFARFGRIHLQLKPYFEKLVKEASETGIPVIRHPWLVCPEDAQCLETQYQFFVGDDLLVLPATARGQEVVSGYFPEGEWIHLFHGTVFLGGRINEVRAPVGTPAVFVRKGADLGLAVPLAE
jgi:alpha-glucosidase